jgi:hypothetical protein
MAPCWRARPPSLAARRAPAPATLAGVSLAHPRRRVDLLSLVLLPRPRPRLPYLLFFLYLIARAPLARYTRAGARGTRIP